MRRILLLAAFLCALCFASSCYYEANLSVDATAELLYPSGTKYSIGPVRYDGYRHNSLSDDELEYMFLDLTESFIDKNSENQYFSSAMLYLEIYDAVSGEHLRDEVYGVVYSSQSGHYEFAEMTQWLPSATLY